MDPITAVAGALVTNLFGALFGGNNQQQGQVLEAFLDTMTTGFSHRVENIVRDAFTDQNLLEIKTDIMSAATAFRTYNAAPEDDTQLTLACQKVIEARSRTFTATRQIIDRDLGYMRNENIEQKGAQLAQHNQAFKASIVALQAVATLDIMILGAKIRRIPGLRGELTTRLREYVTHAEELKNQYTLHQTRRMWVKFESELLCYDGGEGVGYHCSALCKARRFLDAQVIDTIQENHYQIDPRKYQTYVDPFNMRVARTHNEDRRALTAATEHLTRASGNIQASITLWQSLIPG